MQENLLCAPHAMRCRVSCTMGAPNHNARNSIVLVYHAMSICARASREAALRLTGGIAQRPFRRPRLPPGSRFAVSGRTFGTRRPGDGSACALAEQFSNYLYGDLVDKGRPGRARRTPDRTSACSVASWRGRRAAGVGHCPLPPSPCPGGRRSPCRHPDGLASSLICPG
jgi:hypothetical protein